MRLWIDNTGLQSAARCLDGTASIHHDYDLRGLLQLATLIIFGDSVSLNGFEDPEIATRSSEIAQHLQSLGITEDILSIRQVNEAEYALACQTAANSIAPDLSVAFNPLEHQLVGAGPPESPRGSIPRQIAAIALADEPPCSGKLHRAESSALGSKAIGAVEYMLATSEALRNAVRRTIRMYPDWTDAHSYQLSVFLRYHLNVALGEQSYARYAPAVARAELIQRETQYVLDCLQGVADRAALELRGEPLGIPSTLAALLQRSAGEPQAVLRVAMELRQHSGPLRTVLGVLARQEADTPDSRFEIRSAIAELGDQLRRDLRLKEAVHLRDALEIRLIVGVVPTLSVSVKTLVKWLEERRKKKRTAVLTEVIKASAFAEFSTDPYEKLRTMSTRRSSRFLG